MGQTASPPAAANIPATSLGRSGLGPPASGGPAVESYAAADGYRLAYHRWSPSGPARARVVYLHGIQSHAGWYGYSCERLRQGGFEVFFLDRRGSGVNLQERGHAANYQVLLDDIAGFLRQRREAAPLVPTFVLAVSWGGKLGTGLAAEHAELVDGLGLLCPGNFPRLGPPLVEKLRIAWAMLSGNKRRMIPVPLQDPALFTATPRWREFIATDPFSLREATAALMMASARLDRHLRGAAGKIQIPVLLMLAGKDRIVDNERTKRFFAELASPEKRLIEYATAHHTLEFEEEPELFVKDLVGWLNEMSAKGELKLRAAQGSAARGIRG